MIEHLNAWERLPQLAQVDSRPTFLHGISYAAFLAVNEIIPNYAARDCERFRDWLIEKTIASDQEVAERVDVNQFVKHLLNAFTNGAFGDTPAELARYFKFVQNKKAKTRLSDRQLQDAAEDPRRAWVSGYLYFRPGPVIDVINEYLRRQGKVLALDQADLLRQMKVRPYFVHSKRPQGHAMKFGHGSKTNQYCWCLDLDQVPELGLLDVSDEDWVNSFYRDAHTEKALLPIEEWIDPRKGDLFAIVDGLKDKEAGA